jgi:hypothetical protein
VSRRATLLVAGAALVAVIGCSNLADQGGGVIALEIVTPPSLTVETGDSLQLTARALDKNGDVVPAPITWRAADANVTVDPTTGIVVGQVANSSGRVQATSGSLASPFIAISVTARADTIAIAGEKTFTVTAAETTSPPLVAQLLTLQPPGPLASRTLIYEIVEPVFATPAARTVEIAGGVLIDTVTTGADGAPSPPVTLVRIPGISAPPSVQVEVRAFRTKGTPVPGSGQRFTVLFE